jgi:transketolase
MMGAAAGMAACGLIPFVNTFSFLATFRSGEQFRTSVAYPKLNVKIVANYGGLSDSFDGPTHQSIADIAAVRALPNVVVIVPADAVEVEKALPIIADYEGPVCFDCVGMQHPLCTARTSILTWVKRRLLRMELM